MSKQKEAVEENMGQNKLESKVEISGGNKNNSFEKLDTKIEVEE